MARIRSAITVASFLMLAACGTTTNDTTLASYDRQMQAQTDASASACRCYAALPGGYTSESACLTAATPTPLTAEQRTCLTGLFQQHADTLNPMFECRTTVMVDAKSCLDQVTGCDAASIQACFAAVGTAAAACPTLDSTVQLALEACVPPTAPN